MNALCTRICYVLAALVAFVGCGNEDAVDCAVGVRGCACTTGGACDPGSICMAGLCVDPAPPSGPDAGMGVFDEGAIGDLPDCVARCGHGFDKVPFVIELTGAAGETRFSVGGVAHDRLIGVIDDGPHQPGFGYDVDFIAIKAPARTVVEVQVVALAGSAIDPYVSTFDATLEDSPPLYGWMTQNDNLAAGVTAARTTLAAPTAEPGRWFVAVDDARNVRGQTRAGGPGFRYELRLTTRGPVQPLTLDLTGATPGASVQGANLANAGDIHYYAFSDPVHHSYMVTFTSQHPRLCGHIWQIDWDTGAAWLPNGAAEDDPADGCQTTLQFQTFPAFYESGTHRYGLAVTAWDGSGSTLLGGPASYGLTLMAVP